MIDHATPAAYRGSLALADDDTVRAEHDRACRAFQLAVERDYSPLTLNILGAQMTMSAREVGERS